MKTYSLCLAVMVSVGCGSDADGLTLEGGDLLKQCDIHAAHDKFAAAYDDDDTHPQAALGFALTDLALLPEAPAVTGVLTRIGFTGAIDMQALVFGPEGALARTARGDTCASIDTFVNATVPYPPLADTELDKSSLVDPTLTAEDFAGALAELSPRLEKIARALETAASNMTEPVEVDGGCGMGKITFQAPELYALAALIETGRSVIQLGQGYDWNISIRGVVDAYDDGPALAALLNAHLGHLIDPSAAPPARAAMSRATNLALKAIDAAKVATATPDGLFDWTAFPDAMLDDASRLVASVDAALTGASMLADIAPALSLDLSSVFTTPPDLAQITTPLFTSTAGSTTIDLAQVTVDAATSAMFAPSPFAETAPSFTWAPSTTWDMFDSTPVTMPFDRFDTIYTCMTAPPI